MNIAFLCQYNPYIETSATANRIRGLVEGLSILGHHITLVVAGGQLKQNEAKCFVSEYPNIKVVYISFANHYNGIIGRLNTYFFYNWHTLRSKRKFRKMISHEIFDIIWLSNNGCILNIFLKLSDSIKAKTLIELNEYNDIYKVASGNLLQRRMGLKGNKNFIEAVHRIDLFAVMTETLIAHYKQLAKPEAQFLHLPMTVDLTRFVKVKYEANEYRYPYIAFTGTMNNQKDGVDILIKSFAVIAEKYPELHLYLAGFWHYDVPAQEKLIKEFGLADRIHHIGVLDRDSIPPFVSNAALLALSRPDTHQAQGGFPTKLGEYLATANPVCVTRVGEIPLYLKDNESAFLATPGDVNSFADAMDRALCNEENAKQVGANGRKVAEEHFNAAVQSKRLADFLAMNR